MADEDPQTLWATAGEAEATPEVTIDLGAVYPLSGFTYWPSQERYPTGIITSYEFLTSPDGRTWTQAARGEFGNIVNNRIEQVVPFKAVEARFIRLRALETDGEGQRASFAEIGVITEAN
jgi:alpha-L-fucosidase